MNKEKGITLIALIITIIILVILAAVSIRAAYNMGIVSHAVNGAEGYDVFFATCNHHGKKITCKKKSWKNIRKQQSRNIRVYLIDFALKKIIIML